jgi:hypothetical protein
MSNGYFRRVLQNGDEKKELSIGKSNSNNGYYKGIVFLISRK